MKYGFSVLGQFQSGRCLDFKESIDGKFVFGLVVGLLLIPAAVYFYFASGTAPVATTAPSMPFERTLAHAALHARLDKEVPKSVPIAADDAVFGQPQVRHAANTDFIWVALVGFKNALRYALTGDHVDAQEALRIKLINQVVPKAELLETCFKFVERIAHVPPETVKINLHISTQGLEMMGLRKAWMLNAELASMARLSKREEFNKKLEDAKKQGGLEAFLKERDAPFHPEPFGPRSKK